MKQRRKKLSGAVGASDIASFVSLKAVGMGETPLNALIVVKKEAKLVFLFACSFLVTHFSQPNKL